MDFKRLTSSEDILAVIGFHNKNSEFVVIDVETTSEKPRECVMVDIQISGYSEDSAFIFAAEFGDCLKQLSKRLTLVAHNYKFDAHVIFRHGVDLLSHTWRDTLLIGHLLDENRESYSLDSYVKEYWNDGYKEEFWAKHKSYQEADEAAQVDYACRDVVYTGRLFTRGTTVYREQQIPDTLVEHVHRLQSALLRTEIEGVRVDLDYLRDLGVRIKGRINELEPQMRGLVADDIDYLEMAAWQSEMDKRKTEVGKSRVPRPIFSFESPKQLQGLLYNTLALPVQLGAKTKTVSTDFDSLEKIKHLHPVVALIQENRELQKVYTAYIEGTLDRIDQERIYPSFRVAGTVTGRLSHSNPNLAQLPKSGGVRGIYVPDRGRVFISADYSQLEVVVEADLTGDKSLIHMLENGESKHDITARELGCSRDNAKTINFALQYWASHYKIAKLLNCSVAEGLNTWRKYWEVYSGPKELKAKTDRMVNEGIPLKTVFGRLRRFPMKARQEWDGDYRQAYNFLVQSTGADITSMAFYRAADELGDEGRALFSIHDEIIIEVKEEFAAKWDKRLVEIMEQVGTDIGLKVPLKAVSSGPVPRWVD